LLAAALHQIRLGTGAEADGVDDSSLPYTWNSEGSNKFLPFFLFSVAERIPFFFKALGIKKNQVPFSSLIL
jgi:hypothetical protein